MPKPETCVIALTGGVGSGKTEVSDRFAALGVPVIDTDRIARELVEPGKPLLTSITGAFGAHLLDELGRLKRRLLREIVFSDRASRRRLESLMHPAIRNRAMEEVAAHDSPYCIVVIPLLAEKGVPDYISRVLVVDTDPETQIDRVMKRDQSTRDDVLAIIRAQASRAERLAIADDVIENSGDIGTLDGEVRRLHEKYLALAAR